MRPTLLLLLLLLLLLEVVVPALVPAHLSAPHGCRRRHRHPRRCGSRQAAVARPLAAMHQTARQCRHRQCHAADPAATSSPPMVATVLSATAAVALALASVAMACG